MSSVAVESDTDMQSQKIDIFMVSFKIGSPYSVWGRLADKLKHISQAIILICSLRNLQISKAFTHEHNTISPIFFMHIQ